jgi:hypothetical protein
MAQLANYIWDGVSTRDGRFEWYGLHKDASMLWLLSITYNSVDNCTIMPSILERNGSMIPWPKNASFDLKSMSRGDYDTFLRQSVDEYLSIIVTHNADLTTLRLAGTKMIAWHGIQDQLIPPNGTIDYYDSVLANDMTETSLITIGYSWHQESVTAALAALASTPAAEFSKLSGRGLRMALFLTHWTGRALLSP